MAIANHNRAKCVKEFIFITFFSFTHIQVTPSAVRLVPASGGDPIVWTPDTPSKEITCCSVNQTSGQVRQPSNWVLLRSVIHDPSKFSLPLALCFTRTHCRMHVRSSDQNFMNIRVAPVSHCLRRRSFPHSDRNRVARACLHPGDVHFGSGGHARDCAGEGLFLSRHFARLWVVVALLELEPLNVGQSRLLSVFGTVWSNNNISVHKNQLIETSLEHCAFLCKRIFYYKRNCTFKHILLVSNFVCGVANYYFDYDYYSIQRPTAVRRFWGWARGQTMSAVCTR